MKRAILITLLLAGTAMAQLKIYYWMSPHRGMTVTKTGNPAHQENMEAQLEFYAVREDPNDPNSAVVKSFNAITTDPNTGEVTGGDDQWYTHVSQDLDPAKSVDPNEAESIDPNEAE